MHRPSRMTRVKESVQLQPVASFVFISGIISLAVSIALFSYIALMNFVNVSSLEVATMITVLVGIVLTGIGIGSLRSPIL